MISVAEAKRRMMAAVRTLPGETMPLAEAVGRFIVRDAVALYEHPLFDCSAMDGYAFAHGGTQWKVVGEVAAGDAFPRALLPGECVRIFTGAMIPKGADTVVMQELVQRKDYVITHTDGKLERGGNVRYKGEQLRTGDVALVAGARLGAPAIGLLASVGIREVTVARRPRVALLISGDEFAEDGTPAPGKIFGSNGIMLQAALRKEGIDATVMNVRDHREALIAAWMELAPVHDVIISTGGVSVGDHDLIPPTLKELDADIRFHGVMQKPGKPMLLAVLDGTAVFGLPGNPRAVMVLFLEYVAPFLRAMQGCAAPWLRSDVLPIAEGARIKGDRAEFRAACVEGGIVKLLADEGSHKLRSLTEANAIAFIPAEVRELKKGDPLEVHYTD
jgi:molybdopterin molybdotransferase